MTGHATVLTACYAASGNLRAYRLNTRSSTAALCVCKTIVNMATGRVCDDTFGDALNRTDFTHWRHQCWWLRSSRDSCTNRLRRLTLIRLSRWHIDNVRNGFRQKEHIHLHVTSAKEVIFFFFSLLSLDGYCLLAGPLKNRSRFF